MGRVVGCEGGEGSEGGEAVRVGGGEGVTVASPKPVL